MLQTRIPLRIANPLKALKNWQVLKVHIENPKTEFEITSDSKKFEPDIKAYLAISLDRIIVLAPSIPHFKGLSNLQYWIRICQKNHNTVTNH